MNPIRHAGPDPIEAIISARSRARSPETRIARAALVSVVVLVGAVSCAEGPTAPIAPSDPYLGLAQQYDSVAPLAQKEAPLPSLSRSASMAAIPVASSLVSASAGGSGSLSRIESVAFAPEVGPFANLLPGCDDCVFGGSTGAGFDIGFNFNFFGKSYSKFWLSTNGFIAFEKPLSNGCCHGRQVPVLDSINNMIALAWVDMVPSAGEISFETRGAAPRRRLIVNFDRVLVFNEGGKRVTAQLILFEGTNAIELHTTSKPSMVRHLVTQAAENALGDDAAFVSGRVAHHLWPLSNDAVRFSGPLVNGAPSASAVGNAEGVEGVAVEFKGSGVDPDGDPLSYSWDFDNNGVIDARTAEASFVYADNGAQTAVLTVSDGRGGVAEARVSVVIHNARPVVDAGSDLRVKAGETAGFSGRFSDKGAKDAPWSWTWDLGSLGSYSDKTESQSDAILGSKRFCKAGSFPVKLSVVDKDGGSGSDELLVTVEALSVDIDVSPNAIHLNENGHGMVTVRIYSREGLEAAALNPEAIKLTNGLGAGTPLARSGGRPHWSVEDLNGDGRPDVVAGFRRDELIANGDLSPSTSALSLSGEVGTCGDVVGRAAVRVVEGKRVVR